LGFLRVDYVPKIEKEKRKKNAFVMPKRINEEELPWRGEH
jgi:hypothetical protein